MSDLLPDCLDKTNSYHKPCRSNLKLQAFPGGTWLLPVSKTVWGTQFCAQECMGTGNECSNEVLSTGAQTTATCTLQSPCSFACIWIGFCYTQKKKIPQWQAQDRLHHIPFFMVGYWAALIRVFVLSLWWATHSLQCCGQCYTMLWVTCIVRHVAAKWLSATIYREMWSQYPNN